MALVKVCINGVWVSLGDGANNRDCHFRADYPIVNIAGANTSTFGLRSDGTLYSWGSDASGVAGHNTTAVATSSPVSVVGNHSFAQIAQNAGTINFTLGLKSDGTAWSWGTQNSAGQLGDNTATDRSSPVSVVGAHSFIQVACGSNTGIGLKADGSVWAWGGASTGNVGDNQTTANRSSPVSISAGTSYRYICGGGGGYAIRGSDGICFGWGANGSGQLGDNSATSRSVPVNAVGGHSFRMISAGSGNHIVGLKADGTAWGWGQNLSAQLGDNTLVNKSSPVSVVGAHSFTSVFAGLSSTYGLKADGSVWAWGSNAQGQLGDNTATARSSPVSVVGNHSFVTIAGCASAILATKSDGSVWGWGFNTSGQIRDNTATNRSSPVSVVFNPAIRTWGTIVAGDKLLWDAPNAGTHLFTTDRIDLDYQA